MKDGKDQILAGRVPKALVKRLDRAAEQSARSRSAEMRVRLEHSLATNPVLASASHDARGTKLAGSVG